MKKLTLLAACATLIAGQAFAADPVADKGDKPHKRGHHFEETDTNKDGVVTKAEFHARGDQMFAKLDKNGDGKIDAAERDATRKEWEAKRAEWKAKREAAATKTAE